MTQIQPKQTRKTNVLPFKRKKAPSTEETLTNKQMFTDTHGNEHEMWPLSTGLEREARQPAVREFPAGSLKRSEEALTRCNGSCLESLGIRELCSPEAPAPKLEELLSKVKAHWQGVKSNDRRRAHELAEFQSFQYRSREDDAYSFKTRVARAFNNGATKADVLSVLPATGIHMTWVKDVAREYGIE